MKQVVRVKLLPSPEQAAALDATLRTCNSAANWLSQRMNTQRVFRKFNVQRAFYTELRTTFGLAAQPAIRVIGKVSDCYTRDRTVQHHWRATSAQPFYARCLSWKIPGSGRSATISIWTVFGRLKDVRVTGLPAHLTTLRTRRIGETDLICLDGQWFLHATVDVPEAPVREPNGFLGVDMGIVNIATTSDGARESGARLNSYRERQLRLRKRLQAKKTSSARRLLKKRRRKENRFATDINHIVSKRIVAEAERTGRGIAIEQLKGIRNRVRLRKPQRATLHSWAFHQLGQFLEYKARRTGVAFIQVDPAYTSQRCQPCGYIDRKNRRSQALFVCGRCGFVGHADHNAAGNIAARGVVHWGEVMRPHAAPIPAAS